MFYKKIRKNKRGFTLVEIMVSVAIFSIVVTAGMGALMSMLRAYKFSQTKKKASDNMNYVLENFTREIRLGAGYFVAPADLDNPPIGFVSNGSVEIEEGNLIGLNLSDNRGYVIFFLKDGVLMERKFFDGKIFNNSLTDRNQVEIKRARVSVLNAGEFDKKQPLVWIQLNAFVKNSPTPYVIQTLVSQRELDIQ